MEQPQSLTNFKSLTALWWGVEMKFGVTEEERREAKLFLRQTGEMANSPAQMGEGGYKRRQDTALGVVFIWRTEMLKKQHKLVKVAISHY